MAGVLVAACRRVRARRFAALAVSAAVCGAVSGGVPAAALADTTCGSSGTPGTFTGSTTSLTVPAGATCTLEFPASISGNVTVQPGATLDDEGAAIGHDLAADHPTGIGIEGGTIGHDVQINAVQGSGPSPSGDNFICDASVGHDVMIQNGSAGAAPFDIGDSISGDLTHCVNDPSNTIAHDLHVQSNADAVDVAQNEVGHDMQVANNTGIGGTSVAYNEAAHSAHCQNNGAPVTGLGNVAPQNMGCVNHCSSECVVFVQQPSSGAATKPITDSLGHAVTAEIIDSSGHVVTPATGSTPPQITITLLQNPQNAHLGGTPSEAVSTTTGVASFGDLTLSNPGNYILVASAPGAIAGNSAPFDQQETVTSSCGGTPAGQCTTEIATPASDFKVVGSGSNTQATLTETVDTGTPLQCEGLTDEDPNWYGFVVSSSTYAKTITYTLNPPPPPPSEFDATSVSGTFTPQFCLGAPYEFTTNTGAQASPATMPDGSQGFIGLLPDCGPSSDTSTSAATTSSGPCVASRSTNSESGITLTVQIPAGLKGDPWGRAA